MVFLLLVVMGWDINIELFYLFWLTSAKDCGGDNSIQERVGYSIIITRFFSFLIDVDAYPERVRLVAFRAKLRCVRKEDERTFASCCSDS